MTGSASCPRAVAAGGGNLGAWGKEGECEGGSSSSEVEGRKRLASLELQIKKVTINTDSTPRGQEYYPFRLIRMCTG